MHRLESLDPGEHALGVELGPEPGHMQRSVSRGDRIQGSSQVGSTSPVAGSMWFPLASSQTGSWPPS